MPDRRCRTLVAVAAALMLMSPAARAGAEEISFEFTGQISTASGQIDGIPTLPFAVGDPVSAVVTFDASVPDDQIGLQHGTYYASILSVDISVGTLEIFYDWYAPGGTTITCNVDAYCPAAFSSDLIGPYSNETVISSDPEYQWFYVNALAYYPGSQQYSSFPAFEIYLERFDSYPYSYPLIISNDELPTMPYDVGLFYNDAFHSNWASFQWNAPPSSSSTDHFFGSFVVETMTLVPEPSMGLLLGVGVLALALGNRRFKRGITHRRYQAF